MGEAPENMVLVEDVKDVEALSFPADAKLAYLTQTTLSVDEAKVVIDALKKKYPQIVGPSKDDICYATQNRQEAVRELVPEADVVLVLGSQQQLEQPAARGDCPRGRQARASDRSCRRATRRLVPADRHGPHHRRGQRSGGPRPGLR